MSVDECLVRLPLLGTTLLNCSMESILSTNRSASIDSVRSSNDSECVPAAEEQKQLGIGELYVQILFGVAYAGVWFVGVVSNILTLTVAFSIITGRGPAARVMLSNSNENAAGTNKSLINFDQRRRRTVSSLGKPSFTVRTIFVGSLACSDLLTSMTSLPVTAVNLFTDVWPFPAFVCPGVGFLQAFSIFQSSFTFTAIAVDRFLLILYSDSPWPFTYKSARWVVIAMACLAFALAFPMFAFVSVAPLPRMCGEFCIELWPDWASSIINRRTYGLFVLTLQFGLPTVVTTLCYLTISRYLRKCHRTHQGKDNRSKSERRSLDRRRRANGMMISMVCCFVIFWSPLNALNILRDFDLFQYLFDWSLFGILYAVAHLIAMTSVVWNPFIYAWYNRSIREVVLAMFRHALRQQQQRRRSSRENIDNGKDEKGRRGSSGIVLAPLTLQCHNDDP